MLLDTAEKARLKGYLLLRFLMTTIIKSYSRLLTPLQNRKYLD